MYGYPHTPPTLSPQEDAEIQLSIGPYHVPMFRACKTGTYDKDCPFVLRCARCDNDIRYNRDDKDPPASTWTCGGCTAPGNLVFTDMDLEKMSLVAMQQRVYVARRYSTKEELFKIDSKNGARGSYSFTRPMKTSDPNEYGDYHERIVNSSVAAYVKERK
jgi:hypothetical protein